MQNIHAYFCYINKYKMVIEKEDFTSSVSNSTFLCFPLFSQRRQKKIRRQLVPLLFMYHVPVLFEKVGKKRSGMNEQENFFWTLYNVLVVRPFVHFCSLTFLRPIHPHPFFYPCFLFLYPHLVYFLLDGEKDDDGIAACSFSRFPIFHIFPPCTLSIFSEDQKYTLSCSRKEKGNEIFVGKDVSHNFIHNVR